MTAVVLFTRDLRVRDHPALASAVRAHREVVPLFVLDDRILAGRFASPNRVAFLLDALGDLRDSLRRRGGDLVVRRGDVVEETLRVAHRSGATEILATADVGRYAQQRVHRLARACAGLRMAFRSLPGRNSQDLWIGVSCDLLATS
ncbi:MAG: deoxyribodipyrimidine photo-lyase [Thermoanaerobaculia bacterium]